MGKNTQRWSSDEIINLFLNYAIFGNSWSRYRDQFPTRSLDSVKNKFRFIHQDFINGSLKKHISDNDKYYNVVYKTLEGIKTCSHGGKRCKSFNPSTISLFDEIIDDHQETNED